MWIKNNLSPDKGKRSRKDKDPQSRVNKEKMLDSGHGFQYNGQVL